MDVLEEEEEEEEKADDDKDELMAEYDNSDDDVRWSEMWLFWDWQLNALQEIMKQGIQRNVIIKLGRRMVD